MVGYVRVSSVGQNPERQYEAIGEADRVFEDRVSGRSREERAELRRMIEYVRDGDHLRVASMDRLARSLPDLLDLVRELTGNGVEVEFVKEALTFRPGAADAYANFQMHVLGAVAELERTLIAERRAEGIALAKAKGKYRGRKPALTPEKIEAARRRIEAGEPTAQVARDLGVGRSSLYRALNGEGTYADPAA
ncbi:recombinase family protein [Nocardioides maradonensis]